MSEADSKECVDFQTESGTMKSANSGCISALNEKVMERASLGPPIKKVMGECFATLSAIVTAGTGRLVPACSS